MSQTPTPDPDEWVLATADLPPRSTGRRGVSGALALVLIGAGAFGGAAVTHLLWPRRTTTLTPVSSSGALSQLPSYGFRNGAPGFGQLPGGSGGGNGGSDGSGNSGAATISDGPTDSAAIAAKVDDAIVDINTTIAYGEGRAAGTGMVLTSTGEVLTNNHVISGATSIRVTDVGNGETYKATVVGYDVSKDIALLQLTNATGLATITSASSPAQVGAGVVGVGNADGAGGTPSYAGGVVVNLNQPITATDELAGTSERLTGLIETDANIVAGDSGGPLVNEQGQVVGMDTAASTGYRFNQTADAYAIPIATALRTASQIAAGQIAAGQIAAGQSSSTVHIGPTAMLGVQINTSASYGALIAGVLRGGPAAAAGLSAGDTIVSVGGHAVHSPADLSRTIVSEAPGTTVTVRYLDPDGATRTAQLRLATGPPQ